MSGESHERTVTDAYECYHGVRVVFNVAQSPSGEVRRWCIVRTPWGAILLDESSTVEVATVMREHLARGAR